MTVRPARSAVWITVLSLLLMVPAARAAAPERSSGSLSWIPADAAFYSASLRTGEQLKAIAGSRAWAKLTNLPAVQMALQHLEAQLKVKAAEADNPLSQILPLLQQPENRQLLTLLGDLFSQEFFLYGSAGFSDVADLTSSAISAARYGPMFAQLRGEVVDQEKAAPRAVLKILNTNLGLIKVPDFVMGFKLSQTNAAEAQLQRLEDLLKAVMEQEPMLKGRLQRTNVGGDRFLALTLDGSMIPWDQGPFKQFEDQPGELDPLVQKLRQMKLTVSLGMRRGYLLLAVGEKPTSLGQDAPAQGLLDRSELQPFVRSAGKRLTSISYVSQALMCRLGTNDSDIRGLVELGKSALPKLDVPEDKRKELARDLQAFAKELQALLPRPGAAMAFSFLSDRGQEAYSYDWTQYPGQPTPKPLTLLEHLGGSPLLAVVGSSEVSPAVYQKIVAGLKKASTYFEELALPKLEPAQRDEYEKWSKVIYPLLRKLEEITGTMLLPALAEGQSALVFDAKLMSKQWVVLLPPTEKPLPMLEIALVKGVSDPKLLLKAGTTYREWANDAIAKVREQQPNVPEFTIPAPQSRDVKSGTIYFYSLPGLLDSQLLPNAALSSKVLALSLSAEHSSRLLTATPLKTDGGPLADAKRPLLGAAYFSWAGWVDALTPWIEVGVNLASDKLPGVADAGDEEAAKKQKESVLSQVRTVLEVLKVFRGYTSATYPEGSAVVTHSESIIRDLEEK